jgi:hypothetical protein
MVEQDSQKRLLPFRTWRIAVLVLILICGFGTRLYDLDDPPLDYAPSRQLRSAIISRGIYYQSATQVPDWQKEIATKQRGSQEKLEPEVMEHLTGWTYLLLGGVDLRVARIYASLFWTLGGLALYFLIRSFIGDDGAVIGLLFYLFDPFALLAGRTFQPDPLMTALIVLSWYCFLIWRRKRTLNWSWAAGLSTGAAIFTKSSAAFFLFFGMAGVLLMEVGIRKLVKDSQVWLVGIISILPTVLYHVQGFFITGDLQGQLAGRLFNPSLWGEGSFYRAWLDSTGKVLGHEIILGLALLGSFLINEKRMKIFILSTWIGFVVYGFAVPYYVTTHSYYLLPIIPLAAVGLGAGVKRLIRITHGPVLIWLIRVGASAVLVLGVAVGYFIYNSEDFRHEPGYYHKVASFVSPSDRVIALSQDYGFRLAYYGWIVVQPYQGIDKSLSEKSEIGISEDDSVLFAELMDRYDAFIITRMDDFRDDPFLSGELDNHYHLLTEGGGYRIYDLHERLD